MFHEIFLKFREIKNWKFCKITETKISQTPYVGVQWGGEGADQYSPGASSMLTKIELYSSSVYPVFHSVIYNSVVRRIELNLLFQKDRGKTASAAKILSQNPMRRPLPCILIKSFFYALPSPSLPDNFLYYVCMSTVQHTLCCTLYNVRLLWLRDS